MSVVVISHWAYADTEAEMDDDLSIYPSTCTVYTKDTQNTYYFASGVFTPTTAVNHYVKMKIWLQNGTGTSLKIQATCSAGTITPGINSYWRCRRMSPSNIGTFAA